MRPISMLKIGVASFRYLRNVTICLAEIVLRDDPADQVKHAVRLRCRFTSCSLRWFTQNKTLVHRLKTVATIVEHVRVAPQDRLLNVFEINKKSHFREINALAHEILPPPRVVLRCAGFARKGKPWRRRAAGSRRWHARHTRAPTSPPTHTRRCLRRLRHRRRRKNGVTIAQQQARRSREPMKPAAVAARGLTRHHRLPPGLRALWPACTGSCPKPFPA